MLGILAAVKIKPHVVGTGGIQVRNGFLVEMTIPWDAVKSVSSGIQGSRSTKQLQIDGQRVSIVVTGQTNVTIHLTSPVPQLLNGNVIDVTEVRLFADDAAGMARACRARSPGSRLEEF